MDRLKGTNSDTKVKPNVIGSLPSINWKQYKAETEKTQVKKNTNLTSQRQLGQEEKSDWGEENTNLTSQRQLGQVEGSGKHRNVKKANKNNGDHTYITDTKLCKGDSASKHDLEQSKRLTKVIAIDCEMVGVEDSRRSMLARVSIVNRYGNCVYDKFVKPTEPVFDYRTWVSGVRPHDLENGEDFETVKQEVSDMLKGRIVVGHALRNDLNALTLRHPKCSIRDTSKFEAFRKLLSNSRTPALRVLAKSVLGVNIQDGEHSSIQDAKTALQLYLSYKNEWEQKMASDRLRKRNSK